MDACVSLLSGLLLTWSHGALPNAGPHVEQQNKAESHILLPTAAVTASATISAPQLPLVPPLMIDNTAVTATPAPDSFATQHIHACSTGEPAIGDQSAQPVSYQPPFLSHHSATVQLPVVMHHSLSSTMAASLGSQTQAKQEDSHNSHLHPGFDASHTASSTLQHAVSGITQLPLKGPATAAVASATAGQQSRARGKPSNHTTTLMPRYLSLLITHPIAHAFSLCFCTGFIEKRQPAVLLCF